MKKNKKSILILLIFITFILICLFPLIVWIGPSVNLISNLLGLAYFFFIMIPWAMVIVYFIVKILDILKKEDSTKDD